MTPSNSVRNLSARILVWDVPTRLFHWALVVCFAGALITQDMERLRLVHITFGYTMLGLVGFRLVWGVIGSRYARFASFVPSPQKLAAYLRSLRQRQPMHTVGHNPLGALGILTLLTLVIGVSVSGILLNQSVAEELFEEVHEILSNLLLLVVGVHLVGVMISSAIHKENLVSAMINGYKTGDASQGIRSAFRGLGLMLMLGLIGFWLLQFGVMSG